MKPTNEGSSLLASPGSPDRPFQVSSPRPSISESVSTIATSQLHQHQHQQQPAATGQAHWTSQAASGSAAEVTPAAQFGYDMLPLFFVDKGTVTAMVTAGNYLYIGSSTGHLYRYHLEYRVLMSVPEVDHAIQTAQAQYVAQQLAADRSSCSLGNARTTNAHTSNLETPPIFVNRVPSDVSELPAWLAPITLGLSCENQGNVGDTSSTERSTDLGGNMNAANHIAKAAAECTRHVTNELYSEIMKTLSSAKHNEPSSVTVPTSGVYPTLQADGDTFSMPRSIESGGTKPSPLALDAVYKVDNITTKDMNPFHFVKNHVKGATAPITQLEVCEELGWLFVLCNGMVGIYHTETLAQIDLWNPSAGIEGGSVGLGTKAGLENAQAASGSKLFGRSSIPPGKGLLFAYRYTDSATVSLALAAPNRLHTATATKGGVSTSSSTLGHTESRWNLSVAAAKPNATEASYDSIIEKFDWSIPTPTPYIIWRPRAELALPEAPLSMEWVDEAVLLLGFSKEYSLIHSISAAVESIRLPGSTKTPFIRRYDANTMLISSDSSAYFVRLLDPPPPPAMHCATSLEASSFSTLPSSSFAQTQQRFPACLADLKQIKSRVPPSSHQLLEEIAALPMPLPPTPPSPPPLEVADFIAQRVAQNIERASTAKPKSRAPSLSPSLTPSSSSLSGAADATPPAMDVETTRSRKAPQLQTPIEGDFMAPDSTNGGQSVEGVNGSVSAPDISRFGLAPSPELNSRATRNLFASSHTRRSSGPAAGASAPNSGVPVIGRGKGGSAGALQRLIGKAVVTRVDEPDAILDLSDADRPELTASSLAVVIPGQVSESDALNAPSVANNKTVPLASLVQKSATACIQARQAPESSASGLKGTPHPKIGALHSRSASAANLFSKPVPSGGSETAQILPTDFMEMVRPEHAVSPISLPSLAPLPICINIREPNNSLGDDSKSATGTATEDTESLVAEDVQDLEITSSTEISSVGVGEPPRILEAFLSAEDAANPRAIDDIGIGVTPPEMPPHDGPSVRREASDYPAKRHAAKIRGDALGFVKPRPTKLDYSRSLDVLRRSARDETMSDSGEPTSKPRYEYSHAVQLALIHARYEKHLHEYLTRLKLIASPPSQQPSSPGLAQLSSSPMATPGSLADTIGTPVNSFSLQIGLPNLTTSATGQSADLSAGSLAFSDALSSTLDSIVASMRQAPGSLSLKPPQLSQSEPQNTAEQSRGGSVDPMPDIVCTEGPTYFDSGCVISSASACALARYDPRSRILSLFPVLNPPRHPGALRGYNGAMGTLAGRTIWNSAPTSAQIAAIAQIQQYLLCMVWHNLECVKCQLDKPTSFEDIGLVASAVTPAPPQPIAVNLLALCTVAGVPGHQVQIGMQDKVHANEVNRYLQIINQYYHELAGDAAMQPEAKPNPPPEKRPFLRFSKIFKSNNKSKTDSNSKVTPEESPSSLTTASDSKSESPTAQPKEEVVKKASSASAGAKPVSVASTKTKAMSTNAADQQRLEKQARAYIDAMERYQFHYQEFLWNLTQFRLYLGYLQYHHPLAPAIQVVEVARWHNPPQLLTFSGSQLLAFSDELFGVYRVPRLTRAYQPKSALNSSPKAALPTYLAPWIIAEFSFVEAVRYTSMACLRTNLPPGQPSSSGSSSSLFNVSWPSSSGSFWGKVEQPLAASAITAAPPTGAVRGPQSFAILARKSQIFYAQPIPVSLKLDDDRFRGQLASITQMQYQLQERQSQSEADNQDNVGFFQQSNASLSLDDVLLRSRLVSSRLLQVLNNSSHPFGQMAARFTRFLTSQFSVANVFIPLLIKLANFKGPFDNAQRTYPADGKLRGQPQSTGLTHRSTHSEPNLAASLRPAKGTFPDFPNFRPSIAQVNAAKRALSRLKAAQRELKDMNRKGSRSKLRLKNTNDLFESDSDREGGEGESLPQPICLMDCGSPLALELQHKHMAILASGLPEPLLSEARVEKLIKEARRYIAHFQHRLTSVVTASWHLQYDRTLADECAQVIRDHIAYSLHETLFPLYLLLTVEKDELLARAFRSLNNSLPTDFGTPVFDISDHEDDKEDHPEDEYRFFVEPMRAHDEPQDKEKEQLSQGTPTKPRKTYSNYPVTAADALVFHDTIRVLQTLSTHRTPHAKLAAMEAAQTSLVNASQLLYNRRWQRVEDERAAARIRRRRQLILNLRRITGKVETPSPATSAADTAPQVVTVPEDHFTNMQRVAPSGSISRCAPDDDLLMARVLAHRRQLEEQKARALDDSDDEKSAPDSADPSQLEAGSQSSSISKSTSADAPKDSAQQGQQPQQAPGSPVPGRRKSVALQQHQLLKQKQAEMQAMLDSFPDESDPRFKAIEEWFVDAEAKACKRRESRFILAADDLLAVLCFCLARATVPAMAAQSQYLVDCVDNDQMAGRLGYVATSTDIAIQHLALLRRLPDGTIGHVDPDEELAAVEESLGVLDEEKIEYVPTQTAEGVHTPVGDIAEGEDEDDGEDDKHARQDGTPPNGTDDLDPLTGRTIGSPTRKLPGTRTRSIVGAMDGMGAMRKYTGSLSFAGGRTASRSRPRLESSSTFSDIGVLGTMGLLEPIKFIDDYFQ